MEQSKFMGEHERKSKRNFSVKETLFFPYGKTGQI